MHGPAAQWGLTDHLLAEVIDQLTVANWQRTKDAMDGKNPPSRFPRPGIAERSPADEYVKRARRRQLDRLRRGELPVTERGYETR